MEFINDRVLLASQVLDHILELEDSQVVRSVAEDGTQRLVGQVDDADPPARGLVRVPQAADLGDGDCSHASLR